MFAPLLYSMYFVSSLICLDTVYSQEIASRLATNAYPDGLRRRHHLTTNDLSWSDPSYKDERSSVRGRLGWKQPLRSRKRYRGQPTK